MEDQAIFQLAVAHAIAIARFTQVVGQLGHIFSAAGDDHLGSPLCSCIMPSAVA